jgi:pilus assembly protein CpaE
VATSIDQERGQASVELVAVLPAALLIGAVVWQLAVAGQTAWLTANAARVAARAEAVGANARAAARSALPGSLERSAEIERAGGGRVRVSVGIPWLLIGRPAPIRVTAESSLGGEP